MCVSLFPFVGLSGVFFLSFKFSSASFPLLFYCHGRKSVRKLTSAEQNKARLFKLLGPCRGFLIGAVNYPVLWVCNEWDRFIFNPLIASYVTSAMESELHRCLVPWPSVLFVVICSIHFYILRVCTTNTGITLSGSHLLPSFTEVLILASIQRNK